MVREDVTLFVCPDCGGTIPVRGGVRETLLSVGCVFCGAHVTDSAFVDP